MQSVSIMKVFPCILCGADSYEELLLATNYRGAQGNLAKQSYFKCNNCGLLLLMPPQDDELMQRRYAEASFQINSEHTEALKAVDMEIQSIRSQPPSRHYSFMRLAAGIYDEILLPMKPGKLIDIGCGIGKELLIREKQGWDVYGSDYNEITISALNSLFPGHFKLSGNTSDFDEWAGNFDVVMMNQVIEHLRDPRAVLRLARKMVKPGGFLIVVTPNASSYARLLFRAHWIQYWPPEHVALYNPMQLKRLLSGAEWDITRIKTYAAPGTDYALSTRLLLKKPLSPGILEKLFWLPVAWAGTFFGRGSELVVVAKAI